MRTILALAIVAGLFLVLPACTPEDQDDMGYQPAGITFRTDSGYTFQNDTVTVGDTLRIGAMVAEGSQSLDIVYVEMRVDGGNWSRTDTFPFTQNPMAVDFQAIMGAAPRIEDWSVLAVEQNGDATRRSLTFTVQ
ncbi:MAG: hypothetical protein KBH07_11425 [Flavobacteriales bacterium]|nr:hypothetical protein [Flavobacteriales bacterium]MBP9080458.1 hypothetical protein [Flavobacteriales bacterium]